MDLSVSSHSDPNLTSSETDE